MMIMMMMIIIIIIITESRVPVNCTITVLGLCLMLIMKHHLMIH